MSRPVRGPGAGAPASTESARRWSRGEDDRTGTARVAVIIPARNEAPTVGSVVGVASAAELVDEVLVVDDGSSDQTAEVARRHGARVLPCRPRGKGDAMRAGVTATDASTIVFLDADLIGLRADHVDRLIREVVDGGAGMACGLFDRGRILNLVFLHALPILTGERALRRELFDELDPEDVRGYKAEAALNARCADLGLRNVAFVCDGMWHRPKERKHRWPLLGFLEKQLMLVTAMWGYVSYWLRHRLGRFLPVSSRRPRLKPGGPGRQAPGSPTRGPGRAQ